MINNHLHKRIQYITFKTPKKMHQSDCLYVYNITYNHTKGNIIHTLRLPGKVYKIKINLIFLNNNVCIISEGKIMFILNAKKTTHKKKKQIC